MIYECPDCETKFDPEDDDNGNPDEIVCPNCGYLIDEEDGQTNQNGTDEEESLLHKKVQLIPHEDLSTNYYGLTGTIEAITTSEETKRDPKRNNNVFPTGKIITSYKIKFDSLPNEEMCKSLSLIEEMFKVL